MNGKQSYRAKSRTVRHLLQIPKQVKCVVMNETSVYGVLKVIHPHFVMNLYFVIYIY